MLKSTLFPDNWSPNRYQLTKTIYDESISDNISSQFTDGQQNLRNRVASAIYQENYSTNNTQYAYATHYSYDIHGNVKELVQDNPDLDGVNQRYKKIVYDYDLVSGNVNMVSYQPGAADQFYHKYEYDADNRIVKVWTGADKDNLEEDANYQYYKHGPLARTELGGDKKIQGVDYAYTLQGWIKAVNAPHLDSAEDMGGDGDNEFAQDVFGYSLHYNDNDYNAISSSANFLNAVSSGDFAKGGGNLYNGNISKMATAISDMPQIGKTYTYDQLNRLVASNTYEGSGLGASSNYNTSYSYDANGNILSLTRNGDKGEMDDLAYHYEKDGAGNTLNNRLLHVNDDVSDATYKDLDIDDQGSYAQNDPDAQNYAYDKKGNLIKDKQEEIAEIKWNVQGKVTEIKRSYGSTKPDLSFKYDALGNRVSKTVVNKTTGVDDIVSTYYVRDAQGNVMAVYEKNKSSLVLEEQYMYGSSRLGMRKPKLQLYPTEDDTRTAKKDYELTNHLGNVLAVVSDQKQQDGTATLTYATDYFPFGMQMPERLFKGGYRFGFNGKEKIDEIASNGNSLDFGARIYDTRLGRFFSVDPLFIKEPYSSPYIFAANSPMLFIDYDGLFKVKYSPNSHVSEKDGEAFNIIVNNMSVLLEINDELLSTMSTLTGKPESEIISDFKAGSGYTINVEQTKTDAFAGTVMIDGDEHAAKSLATGPVIIEKDKESTMFSDDVKALSELKNNAGVNSKDYEDATMVTALNILSSYVKNNTKGSFSQKENNSKKILESFGIGGGQTAISRYQPASGGKLTNSYDAPYKAGAKSSFNNIKTTKMSGLRRRLKSKFSKAVNAFKKQHHTR